jgi:hypothetical protein
VKRAANIFHFSFVVFHLPLLSHGALTTPAITCAGQKMENDK